MTDTQSEGPLAFSGPAEPELLILEMFSELAEMLVLEKFQGQK